VKGHRTNRKAAACFVLTVVCMLAAQSGAVAQARRSESPAQPITGGFIPPGTPLTATYAEMLSQFRLTPKDADMRATFPTTGMGPALARIAVLYPAGMQQQNIPEARQMAMDQAQLGTNPEQSLADLRSGFQHLAGKYWAERQFLIQVAARLSVAQDRIVDFLKQEISRPVTTSDPTDLSDYSSAVAAEELIDIVSDAEKRDAALLEAIKAQPDKNIRALVISRYEMVDLERARRLADQAGFSNQ
jgi:hypothetical protein